MQCAVGDQINSLSIHEQASMFHKQVLALLKTLIFASCSCIQEHYATISAAWLIR